MFWIMGGQKIFIGLAALTGWPFLQWWEHQLHHADWNGFTFYDMIFPLFLFIAGIAFPFSMARRYQEGESSKAMYIKVIKRGLILVFLGIIYNNAVYPPVFEADNPGYTFTSVLGRIGLAWMFAALIFMNTNLKSRLVWLLGMLITYWLLLLIFPVNGPDPFSKEGNLAGYIDRLIVPGRLNYRYGSAEGLLSTMPAICTALLGMLTGQFVLSQYLSDKPLRKVLYMALAAAGLIILGSLWDVVFPVNKKIWTSSYVCFAGGLSLLLFAIFYLIIDVWKLKKWAFFFTVIGMNPITIYLVVRIIDFRTAIKFFFGGLIGLLPEIWAPFLNALAFTAIGWMILYILYKKKIFLKI